MSLGSVSKFDPLGGTLLGAISGGGGGGGGGTTVIVNSGGSQPQPTGGEQTSITDTKLGPIAQEAAKRRKKTGRKGTILTSGLGISSAGESPRRRTLLGE